MPGYDLGIFLRKLEARGPLSDEGRRAVLSLPYTRRTVPPASYLVREGEAPRTCSVLLAGHAVRHKILGDGGRQIVSLHIPGDGLDLQSCCLNSADHNVQTLTRAELAIIPMAVLRQLIWERPEVSRAILMDVLVESSISREWITNVGRRDARTRLAHLLCEFAWRMDEQQLKGADEYELPMTQEQLGDALGMTSVHVNRSIKALEMDGLIIRNKRTISFPNIAELRSVGDFSALYLHADQRRH